MAVLQIHTAISASVDVVFDLSRNIGMHVASMARSRERAVDGVTTGLIALGEHVTWRAVHFGIPFTMTSKIVEMLRPESFVDEQVSGPFKSFRHRHAFRPSEFGTDMTDTIWFTAPFGPLGSIVDRLALGSYMERLIVERNAHLKAIAESPPTP